MTIPKDKEKFCSKCGTKMKSERLEGSSNIFYWCEKCAADRKKGVESRTMAKKHPCLKCGSEMHRINPEDEDGEMSVMLQFGVLSDSKMLCLHCGYEEKVQHG